MRFKLVNIFHPTLFLERDTFSESVYMNGGKSTLKTLLPQNLMFISKTFCLYTTKTLQFKEFGSKRAVTV